MESDGEDAEDSPSSDTASQNPVHDLDVSACGLDTAESSLELQHRELGKCHGDNGKEAGCIRELLAC